ncbi:ABC transporter permease [Dokdonella sp.]|uniref:ABC transporter permease n=1 Tax=Dokdonella sp. TaxID=2291710 RepID=UPI0031C74662|nr:ABC transporter permease [Dokdonella sp.]
MNTSLIVFWKELRENLRDRRTLANALLVGPLIGPIMFVMIINLSLNREFSKAEAPLEIPVIGAEHAPNLVAALEQMGLVPQPPVADPIRTVQEQDADAVLRIPAGFAEAWEKGEPAQVEIFYDSSQRDAHTPVNRVRTMIEQYSRQRGMMRLIARGLSPSLVQAVTLDARDQSTPQSRAGLIFGMLPYFFVLTIFIGGMYLAIDLTAGERERQSLEPLFANPVARWRILLGKLGAICAFSLASLIICIVAFAFAGQFLPADKLGMNFDLGLRFGVLALLLMLPLVVMLAALQTLVAAFAKSYREAQTYLSILMFVPALPAVALSVVPVKVQTWMYAVPLLAQQVGLSEALRGARVGAPEVALCLASGFALALVVTVVTALVYRSERLAISA